MNKFHVMLLVITIFVGYSGGLAVTSFDIIIDEKDVVNSNYGVLSNQASIPTWALNDTWIYEGDVNFIGENITFDGTVTDVTQSVIEVFNITNKGTVPYYAIDINGDIDGFLTYEWIQGDLQGVINGWVHVRMSDLAVMEIILWSNGTIDVWPLTFNYGFSSNTSLMPALENYDFPIILDETWGIFSNISAEVMFNIGNIIYENFSETGIMNGMMTCDTIENITVPGGVFNTFQIDVHGNGTLTYWYSPIVKNSIKTLINYTSENSSLALQLNMTSHSITHQPLNVTQYIMPCNVFANEPINIMGQVLEYTSGNPITNASVVIRLPNTDDISVTSTDNTGNYFLSAVAPLITDFTPTNYDFGSDGIIVMSSVDNLNGYITRTLTVNGLNHTFFLSPNWNLITVPTEHNFTAEKLGENFTYSSVIRKFNGETQAFNTHVVGTPWDDFPIENGVGYFVFMMNAHNSSVRGMPITSVSIPIFSGWNIIGWHQYYTTTAEELGNSINNCSIIIKFNENNQTFTTHVVGTPWNNFIVRQGMGLFIWSNTAGWWQGDI